MESFQWGQKQRKKYPKNFALIGKRDSPHSGLVNEVFPLPVVFHLGEVGGKHGIEGKDLLLDGAAISDLWETIPGSQIQEFWAHF